VKHLRKVFVVIGETSVLTSIEVLLTDRRYDVKDFTSAEDLVRQYHPAQVGCILVDLLILARGAPIC
jgi:FixJ family two-component response regulator